MLVDLVVHIRRCHIHLDTIIRVDHTRIQEVLYRAMRTGRDCSSIMNIHAKRRWTLALERMDTSLCSLQLPRRLMAMERLAPF